MIAPEELLRAERLTGRGDPLDVFIARCEARALLWQVGEFDRHEAVDGCLAAALSLGLTDMDVVQLIMARAFAAVRDDLNGWRP